MWNVRLDYSNLRGNPKKRIFYNKLARLFLANIYSFKMGNLLIIFPTQKKELTDFLVNRKSYLFVKYRVGKRRPYQNENENKYSFIFPITGCRHIHTYTYTQAQIFLMYTFWHKILDPYHYPRKMHWISYQLWYLTIYVP